jgi:hypothetical protein
MSEGQIGCAQAFAAPQQQLPKFGTSAEMVTKFLNIIQASFGCKWFKSSENFEQ